MTKSKTAKLFKNGRSQAVRLPAEFRMPGKEVRIKRVGKSVVLDPIEFDIDGWFAKLDKYKDAPLHGRRPRAAAYAG
ncbi:MAG: type II toxin-antitoxin system VapB family antitoxin [Rhizomicrobium sp.]